MQLKGRGSAYKTQWIGWWAQVRQAIQGLLCTLLSKAIVLAVAQQPVVAALSRGVLTRVADAVAGVYAVSRTSNHSTLIILLKFQD